MFDPNVFEIGGVTLIALVFGLVEFLKELLGLEGKKVTVLAAFLGLVWMGLFQAMAYLPPVYEEVLRAVAISLGFGLSASGYYKFINKRLPGPEPWIEDEQVIG